jgi:predicted HTH transcriptional regulator
MSLKMAKPFEVFDNPDAYWNLLTASQDVELEDQHFDRKEAGHADGSGNVSSSQISAVIASAKATISGFANENRDGGLVVVGISKTGEVKGLAHLSDEQRNALTRPGDWLVNQNARVKLHEGKDSSGKPVKICLIYVPYTSNAICETIGASPEAWRRQGAQNVSLTAEQKDQLRRDKKIISFEEEYCCPFDTRDLDQPVLAEFRKVYHSDARYSYSDEELLFQAGALIRDGKSYSFNNAGFLFFAANPQRLLSWAFVRLIRFESLSSKSAESSLVTLDKPFTGSTPQQIRNIRVYFQESGFFKKYQKRNRAGGFTEEPEFPLVAVDEAIVNAVAHRDYAVKLPVECRKFGDAFVVSNPGRVLQREQEVPKDFSLADVTLDHVPRNPKLLNWLKLMRDERGAEFVRALSEGTRKMRDEMQNLGLPAPRFHVTPFQTQITLYNNAAEREALLRTAAPSEQGTEFTNLFPLKLGNISSLSVNDLRQLRRDITFSLRGALQSRDWFLDKISYRLRAHKRGTELPLPREVLSILRFYPAYSFQVREYWNLLYLAIDYSLEVKNVRNVNELQKDLESESLIGKTAIAFWDGWRHGRIVSASPEWTEVQFFDFETVQSVRSDKVIPNLPRGMLDSLLSRQGIAFDLSKAIKQHSFSSEPNAARTRAAKTQAIADEIAGSVFPITVANSISVTLQPTGASVSRNPEAVSTLHAFSIPEPSVEFHHHHESPDIRDGITRFGAYDTQPHEVELVPICSTDYRQQMAQLIERLKSGKYKYKGSERTFSTRFSYSSIVTASDIQSIETECRRVLSEHPDWRGDPNLRRLFIILTPERGYSLDDESSPYYRIKRLLLETGVPCQMVDTPTLLNPDWKDLNLALNIIAKCGVTPWVLPDAIPDAHFFVGLSYTQSKRQRAIRMMGYANVFNAYGRWGFYSANSEAFPYEQKTKYFFQLVKTTLERLSPLSETPSIYFHYSAKFSREDQAAILEAARSVRPKGTYSFVWINTEHNVRFYDRAIDTDGSMARGTYVVTSPVQLYISTTGYNPYRRSLGTPLTLEVNIHTEEPNGGVRRAHDLRALARQILSLTKLNWASTDSLCGEPITTKYAGDIAYLTSAFLRQSNQAAFKLHPALEKTPWFI